VLEFVIQSVMINHDNICIMNICFC